jgi:hypothetical protein
MPGRAAQAGGVGDDARLSAKVGEAIGDRNPAADGSGYI